MALGAIRSSHSPLKPVVLVVKSLSPRILYLSTMDELVSVSLMNSIYTVSHVLKNT